MSGSGTHATKEGVKDIAEATKVKSFKASPKESFSTLVTKAVISSTLIRVREHLVGLV